MATSFERLPLALPPNITHDVFKQFMRDVHVIIGDNITVIESVSQLDDGSYLAQPYSHDPHYFLDKDCLVASAVLRPQSVPQVQDIVKLSGKFQIPLWTASIGRNSGYGGAAPRLRGSVVLDLGTHMNRVLEVNVEGAYALVEPGVTFKDLYDYLVANNLRDKLWVDVRGPVCVHCP
jgi:FAD/FMN-containing dehydrogenase